MRVIGVDCGTEFTGYGIIDSDGREHRMVTCGVIRTSTREPLPSRLKQIAGSLRTAIEMHAPQQAAIEEVFHSINAKAALKLAHVRGAAMLTIAEAGLPLGEYAPATIKASVAGYGRAEKAQVEIMVRSLLRLPEPIQSADAADALAVAICHATRS